MKKKIKEVTVPDFQRGDTLLFRGVLHKVVEVLEPGRWHIKNTEPPFNSFVTTREELTSIREDNDPDLKHRPDDRISL